MNENIFEEDMSISYLRAIAAKAQVEFELLRRDTESKDVQLSKVVKNKDGYYYESIVFVQLKATCSNNVSIDKNNNIKYDLKVKNYNDLCGRSSNLKILALLILPQNRENWAKQTPEELIIKHCMYWKSLCGEKPSKNEKTERVTIPKNNILDSTMLLKIMEIASNGGSL